MLKNTGEGTAGLTVFFGEETPDEIRTVFEGFVARHLEQALNTRREPIFRCSNPECGLVTIEPNHAQTIREQGRTSVACYVCGQVISLLDRSDHLKKEPQVVVAESEQVVSELIIEAEQARDTEAWVTVRRATKNYDVFFSYNVADEEEVNRIADQLITNGIMPWLFKRDEIKGRPFQHEIVEAIKCCRLAGVILQSDAGIGKWQGEEVDILVTEAKSRAMFNVIPVVLPNTTKPPRFPDFVQNRAWIDFRQANPDPMQELIRAISGLFQFTLRP